MWTTKAALAQVAKVMSSGEHEGVFVPEKVVGSVLPGLIQKLANELSMTKLCT